MSHNLFQTSRYAVILIALGLIALGLIALIEADHSFLLFRVAILSAWPYLAFLALAGMASLMRGKVRDGLVVLASLAFGLSIIEATATILETKEAPVVFTKGLFVVQPVIGWGPEHPGRFRAEKTDPKSGALIYRADYTIDSNLLRETHSVETGPTIVFFGDSETFGNGLNDGETLPQIFADLLGRKQRVLNLGYSGYGPQQFLAELQTGRFDGVIGAQPRLFIFLTFAQHAERTACKPVWGRWGPRYALESGQLALKGACYEAMSVRMRYWIGHMASYRLFIERYLQKVTHEDVELYVRILLAAVNLAKEKYGVTTLVPYIQTPYVPTPYIQTTDYLEGTGFSNDEIIQRLRDGGAMVVDVSLAKEKAAGAKLRIEGDGHPTPLANRLRALIIKDYIENRMPGILVAGPQ